MDFLKRMKKREYTEMGLKMAIGVILGIIVIFLMEAMICSIYFKAIKTSKENSFTNNETIVYAHETKEDTFDIYVHFQDTWNLHTAKMSYNDFFVNTINKEGELMNTDSELYYISDGTDEYTFAELKAKFHNNYNNEKFTVYTKANAEADFAVKSENVDYYEVLKLFSGKGIFASCKDIIYRKPNAFEIYINGVHYTIMAVFIAVIIGVYVWRFTLISKEYKKLERKFKKTGKVF